MKHIKHTAPGNFTIKDGELVIRKGIEQRQYLRDWQLLCKAVDGTEVCIIRRDGLQGMFDEIAFYRSLTMCA